MGIFKKKKATEKPPESESEEKAEEEVKEKPEEEDASEPTKKGGLPQLVVLAGIIVVLVAASYFLQRTFLFQSSSSAQAHGVTDENAHGEEGDADAEEAHAGEMVMLNEIIVNPAGTGGRRFLAVTLGFEAVAAETHEGEKGGHGGEEGSWIDAHRPLIQDALIGLLSSKSISDLASISYRDTLREEVRARIEEEIEPNKVTRVFFTGYVLQ